MAVSTTDQAPTIDTAGIAVPAIRDNGSNLLAEIENGAVTNQEEMQVMTGWMQAAGELSKAIKAEFESSVKAANNAHKTLTGFRGKYTGPLDAGVTMAKGKIGTYAQEQDRKRRAEETERQRLAQEQADKEALEKAEAFEAGGRPDLAEAALEEAETAVAPVVMQTPAKLEGGPTMRDNWKGEVFNVASLALAVAEGRAPPEFLQVNQSFVNIFAKTHKQERKDETIGINWRNDRQPVLGRESRF